MKQNWFLRACKRRDSIITSEHPTIACSQGRLFLCGGNPVLQVSPFLHVAILGDSFGEDLGCGTDGRPGCLQCKETHMIYDCSRVRAQLVAASSFAVTPLDRLALFLLYHHQHSLWRLIITLWPARPGLLVKHKRRSSIF